MILVIARTASRTEHVRSQGTEACKKIVYILGAEPDRALGRD